MIHSVPVCFGFSVFAFRSVFSNLFVPCASFPFLRSLLRLSSLVAFLVSFDCVSFPPRPLGVPSISCVQ